MGQAAAEGRLRVAVHFGGGAVLSAAWQRALVMQLLAGPEGHRNVTAARQLLMAAGGDLLGPLDGNRVRAELLRAFPRGDGVWQRFEGGPPDWADRAWAEGDLTRASQLLGGGHGFSRQQAAAVMRLVDGLDLGGGQGDRARFTWLSGQVGGLPGGMRGLFGLLVLAVSVFGAGGVDVAGLADLRRLADAARRSRRR